MWATFCVIVLGLTGCVLGDSPGRPVPKPATKKVNKAMISGET